MNKLTLHKDGSMTLTEVSAHPVATKRTTCRACKEATLQPVLSLGNQYLVNFLPTIDLEAPKAPLDLMRCGSCGLLQLGHTVDPDRLFRDFWYRSSVNQTMRDALKDVVRTGLNWHRGGTWLDIGANDGYLLAEVPADFTKIACEPARNFKEELHKVADHVISDYFSADHDILHRVGHGACNVITSVAMFYDLDDPDRFVADIAKCLSPEGIWINQLNDSPTMMKRNAFDSICHEHLCYYDVHTLNRIYQKHGLTILEVTYNEVNGGSVRVVAEKSGEAQGPSLIEHRKVSVRESAMFAERVTRWKQVMGDLVTGPLVQRGPLWCYGASTKGCVLLQYLDQPGAFRAIADRNPAKYGTYMTGTWLPVVCEADFRAEKPPYALVLPWAFKREFLVRERETMDEGTVFLLPLPSIELAL